MANNTNAETYRVSYPEIESTAENDCAKVVSFSEEVTIKSSYVWRIRNFSWTKLKQVGIIESEIFHTNSRDDLRWRMSIENSSCTDTEMMCIRIKLHGIHKEVKANYIFYVLDENHAKTKEGALATMFKSGEGRSALSIVPISYLTGYFSEIFLSDGHLNILCQVTTQLEPHRCGIARDFGLLLESERLSDVKLVVNKVHQFPAHRSVLGSRSPVFATMFENNMIESTGNIVEISDIEPEVVKELLRFIYTERVECLDVLGLELFVAADKYALEDLKFKCEDVLCNSIDAENAVVLLIHADLHRSQRLKDVAQEFIVKNAEEVVMTSSYKAVSDAHLHLLTAILPSSERSA